jgi:hypothetical protein
MLVLDRSASIDAGELTTLKSAATAFVTALSPSTAGAHVGLVSFGTTATLDQALTDSAATINTKINAVTVNSGNYTNLQDGLLKATAELAGGRPNDVIVVITDGAPTAYGNPATIGTITNPPTPASNAAITAANAADVAGIDIFVAGVGTNATTQAYLANNIATVPGNYYGVANYADLSAALANLLNCPNGTPTPNPSAAPTPAVLLSDGFGTTNQSNIPNWSDPSADAIASGTNYEGASSNGGAYALISDNGYICHEVDSTGYNTLVLSYLWRGDSDAEDSDDGFVEYNNTNTPSCSDSQGNWTNLTTHDLNDTTWDLNTINLPAGLNNDSSWLIRFRANTSFSDEYFRVDGVSLTGIPN